MPLQDGRELRLTRGVFPTAPVKPLTECEVKPLESMGLDDAAIAGIMVSKKGKIEQKEHLTVRGPRPST